MVLLRLDIEIEVKSYLSIFDEIVSGLKGIISARPKVGLFLFAPLVQDTQVQRSCKCALHVW